MFEEFGKKHGRSLSTSKHSVDFLKDKMEQWGNEITQYLDDSSKISSTNSKITDIPHLKQKGCSNRREKYFFESNIAKRKRNDDNECYHNIEDAAIGRQKGRPKKEK